MNGHEMALADYLAHNGCEFGRFIYMIYEECGSNSLRSEFQHWRRKSACLTYQIHVFKCIDCGCVTVATIEKKTIGWEDSYDPD